MTSISSLKSRRLVLRQLSVTARMRRAASGTNRSASMKCTVRVVASVIVAVTVTIASAFIAAPSAHGIDYCTPYFPYTPYNGVCTGGWGNYCMLGLACSSIAGEPGTMNPNGYTPRCDTTTYCPWRRP